MSKYTVAKMTQKDNIIHWTCDLCGKKSPQIHWFLIQPSGKYEQKGFSERDYAVCSEECANMLILQKV
jgi:hypothetical protein